MFVGRRALEVSRRFMRRVEDFRCARCGLTRNNQLGKAVDEALIRELAARPLPAARRKRSRQ